MFLGDRPLCITRPGQTGFISEIKRLPQSCYIGGSLRNVKISLERMEYDVCCVYLFCNVFVLVIVVTVINEEFTKLVYQ